MPNNVPCVLLVSGDSTDVDAFTEAAEGVPPVFKESDIERQMREAHNVRMGRPKDFVEEPDVELFQCDKFVPVPDEVKSADYGSDWCRENWGTKWGCYDITRHVQYGDGMAVAAYAFQCAWSPCLPVVEAAAKQWPQLKFAIQWADPYDGVSHSLFANSEQGEKND